MNCPKCGNEITPEMKSCAKCGAVISQPPSPNGEFAQPSFVAPVMQAQIDPNAAQPAKQKKGGKKNLPLKITAIILAIAVLLTGGIFLFDSISYKNSVEDATYIKDFPVLKLETEFKVYDKEKFPYEEYEIKIERYKGANLLKSDTFANLECILEEKSTDDIFKIKFPENGNYRITLTGIVSARTQAADEKTESEDAKVVIIEAKVDNEDPDAVGNVDLNSAETVGNGKKNESPAATPFTAEATQADFDELEKTLNAIFSVFYDPSYDCETADLSYVLDVFWKCGGAYRYYFDEPEYESDYEKLPKENVKWICENIYNIKYDIKGIEYHDYSYFYENSCFYIAGFDVGGNEWDEYEVSSYSVVGDKYEIILDTLRHSYETEDVVFISKIKVTASIKVIDGERYWSLYKVENNYQDGNSTQNEETTELVTQTPTEPSTQAPTQTPTKPSGTVPLDKNVKVGDYVKFGKYEQDNNTSNGKEDIEWLVLDVKDGKALVTSKYALDTQVYNKEHVDITWENCTLRTWLNNDFYNAAFSSQEQSRIPTVKVVAEDSPNFGTDAGNDTLDKVFLLSEGELERYLGTDESGSCLATPYALSQGAYVYANRTDSNCWLWLRSPGVSPDFAAGVAGGGLYDAGYPVDDKKLAVRPVMWITLS